MPHAPSDLGHKILDLTVSRDRLGRSTVRHYDGNRKVDSVTEFDGNASRTTSYGWCTCGSLESITDPDQGGHITHFAYDLQSRLTSKEFADHSTVSYIYENTTSRLASSTDALNQVTNYKYYSDDKLKQISYANALHSTPTVDYTYDNNYGRLASVTDAITGTITYTYYNVTGSENLGAGKLEMIEGVVPYYLITYHYDKLGRPESQSINNISSGVLYDALDRVYSATNALSPGGSFGYLYDGLSPRVHFFNYPNGQQTTYDYFRPEDGDLHLQHMQSLASPNGANLSTFDYTYNGDGQIRSWTKTLYDEPSSSLWFDYVDSFKQLTSSHDAENYSQSMDALDFIYDPAGNRTQDFAHQPALQNNNGVWHDYTVNQLNQATTQATTINYLPTTQVPLTYDANGNMLDDGKGKTFEWDAANRLKAINYTGTGARTEFTYDGLGRRVKITEYGPGVSATIQPNGSKYTLFTTSPFNLPAGNYTLTFTGLEKAAMAVALIDSVTLGGALVPNGNFEDPLLPTGTFAYNPGGTGWSYLYHSGIASNGSALTSSNPDAPDGNQVGFVETNAIMSQVYSAPAGTYTLSFRAAQSKTVNDLDQRVQVTLRPSVGGVKMKTFVWCGNEICEERDNLGTNVTKRFFSQGEQRLGGSDAGIYYYTRDHLGSVREVTRQSDSEVLGQYDYDPYGNRVVLRGKIDTDFGFTGHYYHAPSGLDLTMYRAYDPKLGRWISRDPIGEGDGINLYSYVQNQPLIKTDPTGQNAILLAPVIIPIIIIGGYVLWEHYHHHPLPVPHWDLDLPTRTGETTDAKSCRDRANEDWEACFKSCDEICDSAKKARCQARCSHTLHYDLLRCNGAWNGPAPEF